MLGMVVSVWVVLVQEIISAGIRLILKMYTDGG